MSESKVSNVLDYRQIPTLNPYYYMNRIVPLSGSQVAPLSVTGGNEIVFEIPANAFNLAHSQMYFEMLLPEARSGANRGWIQAWRDVLGMFRTIQLYTRSGVYLCDLNFVHNMTKVVNKAETKLDDMLSFDVAVGAAGGTAAGGVGVITILYPVVSTAGINAGMRRLNTTTAAGQRHDNTASNISYTEPLYLQTSAQAGNVGAGVENTNLGGLGFIFKFPLSVFKNTIFELDKLIYAGEILVFRIVLEGTNKIAYSTGTAAPNNAPVAYPIAAQDAVANYPLQLQNLTLYLATERDPEIVNQLKNRIMSSGLNMIIPYTTAYSIALTGTQQTISLRFNRGNGRRLVKVYTCSFDPTEATNLAYDTSNVNQAAITTFYTLLDNQRLQEMNLDCSKGDDWMLLQEKLRGSVIQSSNMYNYNWFWVDDFSQSKRLYDKNYNEEVGLDLSVERKYDVNLTTTGALNNYAYATFLKILSITPAGITVN